MSFIRLKEIRKRKNVSQVKLAIDLNMCQNTISRYETGERQPGIEELIMIANYFDVSIDYLTGVSDTPCSLTKFLKDEYLASLIDAVNDMTDEEKNNMSQVLKISFPRVFKKEEATE